MEQDIYLITPETEAKLTHAMTLLENYMCEESCYGECDTRIKEAYDTLMSLPFFAKYF